MVNQYKKVQQKAAYSAVVVNYHRVDVVVMRQLLLYCCNSTREPLLELNFPVCIASSNTYQVAYSIFHEFVLMVNISQMLNNPFRWYYGTVVGIMRQHFLYMLLHSLFMKKNI